LLGFGDMCRSFAVARAAFEAAIAEKPAGRFTIRHRIRREAPPGRRLVR
jgi:hypothetical protein